jgi:hypothetical protein
MNEMGQKWTWLGVKGTSAPPSKADIIGRIKVPISDIRTAAQQHGLVDEIAFIAPRKPPETAGLLIMAKRSTDEGLVLGADGTPP